MADPRVEERITMFRKRIATYRKMGYEVEIEPGSRLNDLAKKRKPRAKPVSLRDGEKGRSWCRKQSH